MPGKSVDKRRSPGSLLDMEISNMPQSERLRQYSARSSVGGSSSEGGAADPLIPKKSHSRRSTNTDIAEVLYRSSRGSVDEAYTTTESMLNVSMATTTTTTTAAAAAAGTTTTATSLLMASSVANLCSATLGAGVLSLPYAIVQAGLLVGMLLLTVSAVSTYVSVGLIVLACEHYRLYTYERLTQHMLGRSGRLAVEISLILFCIGCAVSYVIAVGDILERAHILLHRSRALSMITAWGMLMMPLSMLPKMQHLSFASTLGIASIGTLVVSAAVHLIQDWQFDADDNFDRHDVPGQHHELLRAAGMTHFVWPANGWVSVFTACPIVLFSFACQVNVCALVHELPDMSDNEGVPDSPASRAPLHRDPEQNVRVRLMRQVTLLAVTICTCLYTSISLLGMADFGHATTPNILSSYDLRSGLMQVACVAMAAAVMFAFPLNIFPARVTVAGILWESSTNAYPVAVITDMDSVVGGGDPNLTAALLLDAERREDGVVRDHADGNPMDAPALGLLELERIDEVPRSRASNDAVSITADDMVCLPTAASHNVVTPPYEKLPWDRHVLLTLLLTGAALGMALVIPNISVVFGLIGGTATSVLGFCVPGLFGICLARDVPEVYGHLAWRSWALLVGGGLVGVVTTAVTVYSTIA